MIFDVDDVVVPSPVPKSSIINKHEAEKKGFTERLNIFLDVCSDHKIKPILVLFDDCHYPFPKLGKQPLPIKGVHNSGWKQSPGHMIVREINESSNSPHIHRLKKFVQEVLDDISFSSSTYSPSSQSLSFFSVDDLNDDIKIERYNQIIDSIELP